MTQLFTCTSDAPYDKHTYEVILKNGEKRFFNHWEDVHRYWFENNKIPDFLDIILVHDKKSKEKVKSIGFSQ
jgi:hypothetical protein